MVAILVREEGILLAMAAVAAGDPAPVRHAAERTGGTERLTAIHRLRPAHPAVSGRSAPASPEARPRDWPRGNRPDQDCRECRGLGGGERERDEGCPGCEAIPSRAVGGRSGHTWLALSQLAGYPDVRLDGASWAEWG